MNKDWVLVLLQVVSIARDYWLGVAYEYASIAHSIAHAVLLVWLS